ncbi:MAG: hypothetical protein M3005_03780 [Apilactobacillus sp.]|uniref:hypothetical protein n=1 Tax=Apilactobacillus TaxID=2767877 RepID=UPI0025E6103F|nr:hypothetical protein [Apilactobacillus sp.]MCT6822977.1 hypothetical protein [Apilactobacillus sp.]MCT6858720.1 hypothetical protein [Apilactobacillus sp.]
MRTKELVKMYVKEFLPFLQYALIVSLVLLLFSVLESEQKMRLNDFKNQFVSIPYIFDFFALLCVSMNHNRFKLAIQHGIDRKDFWKAKLMFMAKASLVVNLINLVFVLIIMKMNGMYSLAYTSTYFGFFHNYFIDVIFMFITDYIALLLLMVCVNCFGTFASLFNRYGKICFYLILAAMYFFVGSILAKYSVVTSFTHFLGKIHTEVFLNLIFGLYEDQKLHPFSNPINIIISMLIMMVIAAALNLLFTKLVQVKR